MAYVTTVKTANAIENRILQGCYAKELYSYAAMFTTLKVYGGEELEIDDVLREFEEKKLREFEALLDKIPDAGFGFVAYSVREGDSPEQTPEYFWLADASEINELWRENFVGELVEAGVGFDVRFDEQKYRKMVVGDLQFVLRCSDGRRDLTTVRRCLDEYERTGDWYLDAVVSTTPIGEDVCKIRVRRA